MADWNALKVEYITNEISFHKLGEEHGVSPSTIRDRARREGWKDEKQRYSSEVAQQAIEKIKNTESDVAAIKAEMHVLWWQRQKAALDSLIAEEAKTGRNSADARRELQNFVSLLTLENESLDCEDSEAYFDSAGLNDDPGWD